LLRQNNDWRIFLQAGCPGFPVHYNSEGCCDGTPTPWSETPLKKVIYEPQGKMKKIYKAAGMDF
jgi:hypothetical protein